MKKILFLSIMLLTVSLSKAQEVQAEESSALFKNPYINVMGASNFSLASASTLKYYGLGYAVQVGNQFSPYFAAQINISQTFKESLTASNLSADFLWNVSNSIDYKADRKFSVVLLAGADAMNLDVKYASTWYPTLDLGGQLQYVISDSFNVVAELRGGIGADSSEGKYPFTNIISTKLGVTYKFGNAKPKKKAVAAPVSSCTPAPAVEEEPVVVEEPAAEKVEVAEEPEVAAEPEPATEPEVEVEPTPTPTPTPTPAPATTTTHEVKKIPIFYRSEQVNPKAADIEKLKDVAQTIKANPTVTYIVEGYADRATGSRAFNLETSQKRAQAMVDALVETYGINKEQLKAVGKGGTRHLYKESHLNRCVIIRAE